MMASGTDPSYATIAAEPLPGIRVSLLVTLTAWLHLPDGHICSTAINRGLRMDALSEALNLVRMTGAIFFNAEFTAPWGFVAPPADKLVPILSPGAERLVIYHLLTEGRATARMEGGENLHLSAGDIVVVPRGDGHQIFNGTPSRWLDSADPRGIPSDLSMVRYGGGGEATRFVCGYLGCERRADRLFLAGLPVLLKVNIRGDAAGEWLESTIRHLVCEMNSSRPGQTALLSKMAEALFIEALRRHMAELPPEQTGWLAGARDPLVGRALAVLHREPCHPWTLAELATELGSSRSVVTERFGHFLGETPMSYLARWRLQLAARLLQTTHQTIIQVAGDVGYESEAAFNRAFKREFGLPPAQYRRMLAGHRRAPKEPAPAG
jgi:AraC-like DNA-binding protein